MEPIESSETSGYNNTLTPGTYSKEKKLESKHSESLKSRIYHTFYSVSSCVVGNFRAILMFFVTVAATSKHVAL